MLREQKEAMISSVRSDLDRAAGVLFMDFTGLTVDEVNTFRRKLQAIDVGYRVVKNSLMSRALVDAPYADVQKCLKGTPTGVIFGFEDPVVGAKAAFAFMQECEHLKVKGGIVENKAIGCKEAEALSKMLSKSEMQAEVVTLAMSPGRTLAGAIKTPAGKIVGAVEALVKRLEGAT